MLTNEQWKIFYQLKCLKEQGKEDTPMFNDLVTKLWQSLSKEESTVEQGKAKLK